MNIFQSSRFMFQYCNSSFGIIAFTPLFVNKSQVDAAKDKKSENKSSFKDAQDKVSELEKKLLEEKK
jgi:hypothetical protein